MHFPSLSGDHSWYGYEGLIESTGLEILVNVADQDYQGDSKLLVRDPSAKADAQYAVLMYGWGSCSGCDAYEMCTTTQDFEELRADLVLGLQWDTLENTISNILSKDYDTEDNSNWYYGSDLDRRFQVEVREYMENLREL